MKKILVLASIICAALTSCNNNGTNSSVAISENGETRQVSSQIAYVNLDSLLSNYDMFREKSQELEEKATKAENELTSKGRSLERSVADFQEKIDKGLVTRAQAAELQEKLQRQEQSFYQHRDRVQRELAEENQVMMNNLYHNIDSFLKEFNSDYKYGVILSTSGGAPILHADPALDITDLVIQGLNDKYSKEK